MEAQKMKMICQALCAQVWTPNSHPGLSGSKSKALSPAANANIGEDSMCGVCQHHTALTPLPSLDRSSYPRTTLNSLQVLLPYLNMTLNSSLIIFQKPYK